MGKSSLWESQLQPLCLVIRFSQVYPREETFCTASKKFWNDVAGRSKINGKIRTFCTVTVLFKFETQSEASFQFLPWLLLVASHCLAMGGGRMLRFPEVSEFFALIHFICNFPYIFSVYMSFCISSNFLVASLKLTKDYFAMLETL